MKNYQKNRLTINIFIALITLLRVYACKDITLITSIMLIYNLTCFLLDNFTLKNN